MNITQVRFLLNGKIFEKPYDRSKIQLGKVLFVKINDTFEGIDISEFEFEGSSRVAINWIAPSDWSVFLIDKYQIDSQLIDGIKTILKGYLDEEVVEINIIRLASKLRIENLHKTSEFENSSLRIVSAIKERLELIKQLKLKEVKDALWYHWEPVVCYHLLTCFDLLGQPSDWTTFDSWLTSKSYFEEREIIIKNIDRNMSIVDSAKYLYDEYNKIYGVKNSFFRFLREILPKKNRVELMNSLRIIVNSMPPSINLISEGGTEEDKEKFLFNLRNSYTHKAKTMKGFGDRFGENLFVSRHQFQHYTEKKWYGYSTIGWPEIFEHVVKCGFSEFLLKAK